VDPKISQVAQNIVRSRKDLQACCQGFRNPKPSISMVGQSFAASFFKMGPTNSPCIACVLGEVGESGFILLCCINPFLLSVPTTTAAPTTIRAATLTATTHSSQVLRRTSPGTARIQVTQLWGGRGSASSAALIRSGKLNVCADYSPFRTQGDVCCWAFPHSPFFLKEEARRTCPISTVNQSCGLTWLVPASCSSLP